MDEIIKDGISAYIVVDGEPCYGCLYVRDNHYELVFIVNDDEEVSRFEMGELVITDTVDDLGNVLIKKIERS
jgi:hypothetical protein